MQSSHGFLDKIQARLSLVNLFYTVTALAWILWFGATVAVFVFVKHYFNTFGREEAGISANAMFNAFGKYELILAAVSILSCGMLLVCYPQTRWILLLGCLTFAGGMAVMVALGLMPMMDALLARHQQHEPEFIRLHVKSMIAMTIQAGLLFLTGFLILPAIPQPQPPETSEETDPDSVPRAAAAR